MRLLAIANRYPPWSVGGYETVAAATVAALRERGHTVGVLTTRPDPSDLASPEHPPPGVARELRWYWRAGTFDRPGWQGCVALERENHIILGRHLAGADAVLWWGMGGMSLSLIEAVRRAGVPALGLVGDEWMGYGPRVDGWLSRWRGPQRLLAPLAEQLVRVPARVALGRAARWAFNSHHLLALARGEGVRVEEALILPPGIDRARFADVVPSSAGQRLLCLGRLDPRKGVQTGIEALAELPQARLRVHGPATGAERTLLAERAAALGVGDRVQFSSGRHEDVPAVLGDADIVLFPVRWREPWGLVPLEAMAAGRPVIASRAGGGPAEYLREEENCLGFRPGDAADLAQSVRRLAADRSLAERLIAGGRLTAARYDHTSFHDGVERQLADLVARARR